MKLSYGSLALLLIINATMDDDPVRSCKRSDYKLISEKFLCIIKLSREATLSLSKLTI